MTPAAWVWLALVAPSIEWHASDDGCGSAPAFESRLRELAPEAWDSATARIEAKVSRPAGDDLVRLELTLRTADGEHVRSLTAPDCDTAVRAAAVVSAQALALPGPQPADVDPPAPPAKVPAPVASAPASAPPPSVQPERSTLASSLRISVGTVHDGGSATSFAPLGSLGIALDGRRWSLRVTSEVSGRFHENAVAGVTYALVSGELEGCVRLRPDAKVELLPCASGLGGVVLAEGFDVDHARRTAFGWAAARLGGEVRIRLAPRLRLLARAGVQIAGTRPRFTLDSGRTVHRAGPIGGVGGLGLEISL